MSDARARAIERDSAHDAGAAARHLVERVRRGDLAPERLKLAAFAGDAAALLAFACRHDDIRDGDRGCVCWYGGVDEYVGAAPWGWVACMLAVFGKLDLDSADRFVETERFGTRLGARACLAAAEAVWANKGKDWVPEAAHSFAIAEHRRIADSLLALRTWVDAPSRDAARAYELFSSPLQRQRWITSPAHALVGPLGWNYFAEAVNDAAVRVGPARIREAMNKAVSAWALT